MAESVNVSRRLREAVGQKDVPLCAIIGAKLNEYSDGQILKELLQNAEDGGATELTLTIDCRTFPTDTILREGTGQWNEAFEVCQGPALLAWNNSSFTQKDWDSIQLPMRSLKKLDPDSIGKFGLGFLSVYHLTDYPWIVSGDRIMVMDTQKTGIFMGENDEKRAGTDFFLGPDWNEINSLHDQFAPFQSLDLRQDSDVKGTFFRFPLRTAPSIISSTIYTTGDDTNAINLRSLFTAFVEGEEGETLLLFLRSVRKVTLMIHHPNDDTPEQLYQVSVSESNGISCITVINGSETTVTNWKVQLMQGRKQKKSAISLAARMLDNCSNQKHNGYTFCFLPMPFVEENSTGLPFHVHGDFSLSENRRSILWPSADNQHSSKAKENIRLLCEVLPTVFLKLLLGIKKESAPNEEQRSRRIASLWPNLAKLRPPWEAAARPIFEALAEGSSELFWSPYAKKWMTVAESVFTTEEPEKHFAEFFALAKLTVVPYANGAFLQDYKQINQSQLRVLSPKLFVSFLRKDWVTYQSRFSISESIAFLKYVMSTGTLSDIEGLRLLPLSDGSLQSFKKRKEESPTIFSDNASIPQSIFHGLEGRFLHPEAVGCLWKIIADGIELTLVDHLLYISSGGSQLKKVGFSDIPDLVDKMPMTLSEIRLQGGTMFRLPLRKHASDIWNEVFSSGSITNTLKAAGNDAMRMLLFLTSVKQINAYRITHLGEVIPLWESVVTSISDMNLNNDVSLLKFHESLRHSAAEGMVPERMPVVKNTTMSTISSKSYIDQTDITEQWIISTRLGFESLEPLNSGHDFLNINLLPLGSVAKLISCNGKPVDTCPDQVFVSLPLPTSTGLPVSLHGQFCLDSEGRKNFWTSCSNESNDRKLWNQEILSRVLAPAYVDLLEHLTPHVDRKMQDNGLVSLEMFWKTFPDKRVVKTEEWRKFGESVYEAVVKRCAAIIPNADKIGWMAPVGSNGEGTLFTNIHKIPRTRFNFFVQIGMPLPQECPLYVASRFVAVGCSTVSPEDVIEVLRTEPERLCLRGHHLPTNIYNTQFYYDMRYDADKARSYIDEDRKIKNAVDLAKDIFSFIIGPSVTEQPKISLNGIPLLITHGLQVRKFHDKIYNPHTKNNYSIANLFPNSQDEFVLRYIAEYWKAERIEEEFLIKVMPEDVPALLERSFPALRQQDQNDYQLFQDSCLTGDEHWLRMFWSVMLDICDADKMRSQMEPIANWNLIPTKISGSDSVYLFSLASEHRLLGCQLKSMLGELPNGLPYEQGFLYSSNYENNNLDQFLQSVCVNSAVGLIRLLGYWKNSLEWKEESARPLRDYLNSVLKDIRTTDKEAIKRIPIYNSETGSLVSIELKEALFRGLHSSVPKSGAEFWSCGDALFMEHDQRITELYKWLDVKEMDDLMLVQRFVIPALPKMEPRDQVEHLEFIRYKCSTSHEQWQESIQQLTRTPFVVGSRLISEFFDHEEKLFQLMEDDKDFLPTELVNALDRKMRSDWRSFLRKLGFVASPSGEQLLSYAIRISKIDLTKIDEIESKSRAVLQSLSGLKDQPQRSQMLVSQCNKIFNIAFVPSGTLDDKYMKLFAVSKPRQLLKINESPRFSERALIWSSHRFLPKWTGDETFRNLLQQYCSFKLDFSDVLHHASIVLSRLKQEKDMERSHSGINSEGCIETLQSYITELYLELNNNSDKLTSSMEKLKNIPLIPVENGTRLMVPTMVVRKLECDIPPFLYALPEDLKKYKKLLEQIGTTKLPQTRHFTSVLECFFQTSQTLDNPNIAKGIESAQNGLVHMDKQDWENVERVYLLSRKNTLTLSCDLIFKDEGKLVDGGDTLSYWNHPDCEIKRVIDFVATMPQHLKPRSYSGIVERMVDTELTKACPVELCQTSANLELLLKSDQFWLALQRIYYKDRGQVGPMSAWEEGQEFLSSLIVECCVKILVVEKISDHSISAVPRYWPVFTSTNTIYIDHAAMDRSKVSVTVGIAEFLTKALPLRNCVNSTVLLLPLLEYTPDAIPQALAEKEVPELPGPRESKLTVGSLLPPKLIELLVRGPALFFVKGELVGYEVHDDAGELTIMLAEIIEVKCTKILKGVYRIKFGAEIDCVRDVSALDLFQFRSEAKQLFAELVAVGSPTMVSPDAEETFADMSQLEEAKLAVTNMIEEAWKLPLEERRKAIKRIMLEWHPDKNRHRMELATEVFKHIQAELNRLENGSPAMENDFNTYYRQWSRAGNRSRSKTYRQYSPRPRRNPTLGKQYFAQAEENLKTAQNMGENCGSSSAVFMVHQAVELALKGLIISKTGNTLQSHCLYSLADEALSSDGIGIQRCVLELTNKCNTEYMRMVYPTDGLDIPHRLYAQTHRQQALEYGQEIIDHLRPLYS